MFFSSDPAGRKLINIAAQDNQYISAIQFLTTDGKLIGTLSPNQQTANEALSLSVNAASMKQDKVVVAVVDYAGNARAYELELGLGGDDGDEEPAVELNGFFAFNSTNNTWARLSRIRPRPRRLQQRPMSSSLLRSMSTATPWPARRMAICTLCSTASSSRRPCVT